MELKNLDLPQLIVALDSLNDDANYVHIKDVREDVTYYCPCCKGIVKPRAYKKDQEYQVQPHFYHETGGCNEETYVHYICKNWLFEKGCKFIVAGVEYEVDNTKTEETLHTSFGDYRPDIIVTTTIGKVFYFEIRTTNKKTELYAPKWDELGNDVVEVDTRYFINQKHKNDIPEFELIYSNGECFIKSYSRNDYEETIAKRKLEWKRQDKLNYKMQWEKLDWFWCELQKYKALELSEDNVVARFSDLDFKDMEFCMKAIKNHKFETLLKKCIEINNVEFDHQIETIGIKIKHISTMIHDITFPELEYRGVKHIPSIEYRKKMKVCNYSCLCNILNLYSQEIFKTKVWIDEKLNKLNNKLNDLDISDVTYKDTFWKYYDEKYDYYSNSLDEIVGYRLFYDCKDFYEDELSAFKEYINQHKAWYFDYYFSKSFIDYVYLNCILTFNNRNKCEISIPINKNISVETITQEIKNNYKYHMKWMILRDGYIKTNWWNGKIYCEKDRLIAVKEN